MIQLKNKKGVKANLHPFKNILAICSNYDPIHTENITIFPSDYHLSHPE
ncbi:hypothetical protein D8884_09595 [Streptococcus sanguinis]|nr:hypothetical protein D8884_09595 [Streptococcus sanguinis]